MTSIEERLSRDIAAVAGGVVVTESDLREAREELHRRMESDRRRALPRRAAAAAAAAVALAAVGAAALASGGSDDEPTRLAGPSASVRDPATARYLTGSLPTAELLTGVWRLDNGMTTVKFDADGGVRFDDYGTLYSDPTTTGSYAIDGERITVTTTDDDRAGCTGTSFTMRASFPQIGLMRFVFDAAGACTPLPAGKQAFEQVLPTGPIMAGLVFSWESGWTPVSDESVLHGVWMAEGGGHVLELARGGAYYIADGSGEPVDRGEWALREAGLTLSSSEDSTRCSQGDQLVLGSVEWIRPGTDAFRGTVTENTCGGPWTPVAWILLPHEER